MAKEKLVFSTEKPVSKKGKPSKTYETSQGPTKMRLETKGRGGKSVTVLFNLPFSKPEAKDLMRQLQGKLACGASYKEGRIEIRGDMRDKIEVIFSSMGLKVTRAGG